MIIKICDLCGEETKKLKSVILYKKTFDYCENCENKARKIEKDFKRLVKNNNRYFSEELKKKEKDFYKKRIR